MFSGSLSVERLLLDDRRANRAADVDLDLRASFGAVRGNVRHPDPSLQARRKGTARDLAAVAHAVAGARDARAVDREREELLLRSGGAGRGRGPPRATR